MEIVMSEQDRKAFEERFLVFMMGNVELLGTAKLLGVAIPSEDEISFCFAFGRGVVKEWLKIFPESRLSIEEKLGRKLEGV